MKVNLDVGIGWLPNIDSDGVDNEPLFYDLFFHGVPDKTVVTMSQQQKSDCKF